MVGGLFAYFSILISGHATSKTATRSSQFYAESNATAYKQLFNSGVIVASNTASVLVEVKSNPLAIGYDSLGYITNEVKMLKVDGVEATIENIKNGSYKISRPLNIVYQESTITDEVNKAFFAFLFHLLFRKPLGSAGIQEVPCITMELVKEYFQRPKTRQQLKDNKDFLAVAIREKEREGKIVVTLTLYDTQQEEVVMDVEPVTYRGERLDQGLEEAFGDKEMIVLQ